MFPLRPNPLVAFAMLLVLAGCEASTAPAVKSKRPVQVQRVSFTNESSPREFVGVVRARHEIDLGFRVAGKIVNRMVNVGDRVRAGDVVARLDPQDIQLQAESAEAELSAAATQSRASGRRSRSLHHAALERLRVGRGLRSQEVREGRGGRPPRARQALARSRAQSARLCAT